MALRFEDIEPHINGIKCIGFDVFDTLLLRPFMRPTDLFSYMEEKESSPGFRDERVNAERRARREIHREINIDNIYSTMDEKYLHLKEKEIEAELRYAIADPDMKRLYDRIIGRGIDVAIISDMYLSGECISGMLAKSGYSGYKKIYVSNEHKANKHSGKLFSIVLDDLGIRNDEMLFIGDNPHSDHRIPLSLGIRSIRYVSAKERYAASHKREMSLLKKGCAGSSVIISMDMMRWLREPFENYWYEIAYRFGGPVSSFFIRFMMSQIADNIGTILFIARDGYNLQKVYSILDNDPLNNHYVYASRMFATIFGNVADNKDGPRCLFEHFSDAEELKNVEIPNDRSGKDHAKCLAENAELFEKLLEKERSRYSEYIHSKTADEGDVLVVDATTKKFSSQNLIQKALGKDRGVIGCYYNLLAHGDQTHFAYADRSKKMINWTEVNVPEFFLGSPEPPVSDITADGIPIFQKDVHDHELFRTSIYDRITEGELDYAADLKAMFGDDIPNVDHKVIDRWMKILVKNGPSGGEHISKIHWAPDTMHTRYRSLVFGPKEIPYKLADMFSDLK
ncbi:MAG: hypothetical protein LBE48_05940, partial [Methanomassiliicoccaceae archaeon]|nr:hypothetical protein [Methanomassiliicoccaceae archaeon]